MKHRTTVSRFAFRVSRFPMPGILNVVRQIAELDRRSARITKAESASTRRKFGGRLKRYANDGTADFLAANRVVFDIKGTSYRLVAQIKYVHLYVVFIRFVGTHAAYDRIDAGKV